MRIVTITLFTFLSLIPFLGTSNSVPTTSSGLVINFQEDEHVFADNEKKLINEIIINSEKEVRQLLPHLPNDIEVLVTIIDRNIDIVGGVTGRTESNVPALVFIEISKVFPGGISAAASAGLRSTLFHEFHHLARGWAIKDNKYEQGIDIAAVNEGLAVVFSEEFTKVKFEANGYPKEVDSWVEEILALPKNASYQKWMFQHPDGRTSIGYRAGNFIIRQAMANSDKDILELSRNEPEEILKLAGY